VYVICLGYSAIADRNSICLEPTVNGSKIVSYCGHFGLCSEETVNEWAGEGSEKP
jgi:hypothetical protein